MLQSYNAKLVVQSFLVYRHGEITGVEGKTWKSFDVMFVVYLITAKGPWKLASHPNTVENPMSVNAVGTNLHIQAPRRSTRRGSTFNRETGTERGHM